MLSFVLSSAFLLSFDVSTPRDPQELQAFFQRVWSPYCKGNSLLECPSGQAIELRDTLKAAYEGGASFVELEAQLKQMYGDQIYMEPPSNWRGQLAYTLPWIAFFIVVTGLFFFWKKRTRDPLSQQPATPNSSRPIADSEELRRIEEEIQERL